MRLLLTLAVILELTGFRFGLSADNNLPSCPELKDMSEALQKLQKGNWSEMSITQVKAIWPEALEPMDCDEKQCTSVTHRGRVINNSCECCVNLYFGKKLIEGESSGHLRAILINYATNAEKEAVSAAKMLAAAVNLPPQYMALIEHETDQKFSWDGVIEQTEIISILHLTISSRDGLWEIYFNYFRDEL